MPELLCARSSSAHIGTTDIDVQVNLEIASGAVNAGRLESTLRTAGFEPDGERAWRWHDPGAPGLVVKVEFLADLDDVPNQTTVTFDASERLGAVNLRGTGYAARDWNLQRLIAPDSGGDVTVELRVAGLAGYLLAKVHAAYRRRATKDWYDLAYVLIHNDAGGPRQAAQAVIERFGSDLVGETRSALDDLAANFADADAQGPQAYAETALELAPDLDWQLLTNDAVTAVGAFLAGLRSGDTDGP
jgi:hypothetical protein